MSEESESERQDTGEERKRPTRRKVAEWVTLGVSVALVLGVMVFLLYGAMQEHPPFVPVEVLVLTEEARESQGRYVTPLEVRNRGARTIKEITVEVSHRSTDGVEQTAELVIDYLGERASQRVYLFFDAHPRELQVEAKPLHYQLD